MDVQNFGESENSYHEELDVKLKTKDEKKPIIFYEDDSESKKNIVVRLDKWLWAARFFRTRALAMSAVQAGYIAYNSRPVKPSQEVEIGAILQIRSGEERKIVKVTGLSTRRKNSNYTDSLFETIETIPLRSTKRRTTTNFTKQNSQPTQNPSFRRNVNFVSKRDTTFGATVQNNQSRVPNKSYFNKTRKTTYNHNNTVNDINHIPDYASMGHNYSASSFNQKFTPHNKFADNYKPEKFNHDRQSNPNILKDSSETKPKVAKKRFSRHYLRRSHNKNLVSSNKKVEEPIIITLEE